MAIHDLIPWRRMRQGLADPAQDYFSNFRREMDRLFDDFWSDRQMATPVAAFTRHWPSVEVEETEGEYRITAEIAGMDEKDIDLQLRDNALVISGEKRSQTEDGDKNRRISERFYGRFERVIPFDAEIDGDKAAATFKSGILLVTLPKNAAAREKGRRIQITRTN